jgi:hypothetical protein
MREMTPTLAFHSSFQFPAVLPLLCSRPLSWHGNMHAHLTLNYIEAMYPPPPYVPDNPPPTSRFVSFPPCTVSITLLHSSGLSRPLSHDPSRPADDHRADPVHDGPLPRQEMVLCCHSRPGIAPSPLQPSHTAERQTPCYPPLCRPRPGATCLIYCTKMYWDGNACHSTGKARCPRSELVRLAEAVRKGT